MWRSFAFVNARSTSAMVPPHMGRLTESGNSSMILQVSPSWRLIGRAPNHCSPDAPGQEIHRNPAPAPDTEPCESEGSRPRCRVGRQMRLRDARARGKHEPANDDSHNDQRGRRSVRGDAPHAPPQPYRDPTLLQHQRLHQLPHRRSDDRGGNLPDLRIHEADALDRIRRGGRDRDTSIAWWTHPRRHGRADLIHRRP